MASCLPFKWSFNILNSYSQSASCSLRTYSLSQLHAWLSDSINHCILHSCQIPTSYRIWTNLLLHIRWMLAYALLSRNPLAMKLFRSSPRFRTCLDPPAHGNSTLLLISNKSKALSGLFSPMILLPLFLTGRRGPSHLDCEASPKVKGNLPKATHTHPKKPSWSCQKHRIDTIDRIP